MKSTIVVVTDDLDGVTEGAEEVEFGLDGAAYEIDLCVVNRKKLDEVLRTYIDAARPVKNPARNGHRTKRRVQRTRSAWHAPAVEPAGKPPTAPDAAPATEPAGQDEGVLHSKEELTAVRGWAKSKGVRITLRGRIPQDVWDAWRNNGDLTLLAEKRRPLAVTE